ncbi:hypothetical protein ASF13_06435 [Erwinia sp. Leaf53]|nr:hypothetical protein ASF13_06435 [Erwinia sp. Leaf53]
MHIAFRAVDSAHSIYDFNIPTAVVICCIPNAIVGIIIRKVFTPRLTHPQAIAWLAERACWQRGIR